MAKIDFKKLLEQLANNDKVKELAAAGFSKIVDLAKKGLPYRKEVNMKLAEHEIRIALLEETAKALLAEKLQAEKPESDGAN